MELVTGAMGSLLPKLGELLKKEYGLQKGVREKIKSLSRELGIVHAVLRKIGDAPPEQIDELVRLWASDVREASYDMEDIVDAFLVRVDDGLDQEPTDPHMLKRLLKKVGLLFKKSKARRKISSLIQDIKEKLEEVAARRGRYAAIDSMVARPVAAATTIDPRLLSLYKRASELVGIEGPRDELMNKLCSGDGADAPEKKTKIVSVVGFGGLGKTTLAKAVYDQLKPQFERNAFVPVGRNPDVKKVLRDILIDLDKGNYVSSDLMVLDEKQLMDELKELVEEKRCLIVIDDIWDKESWNLIRCALQDGNSGSRVVVTTRISEVAAHVDEAYKMQPLSRANSERLLYARIAEGEEKYFDSPSAEACDKILKKCGGVPLAIITIASLLASKPGEDWCEVYNSIGFGHGGNDDVDNTRRILSFSYYDLPSHLKACLLYLSTFLEDEMILKNNLIWKWVAEGFVNEEQAAGGVGLFDLGEGYFNELINRSMIQPVEEDDEGYVYGCRVHDMVFDLARTLSSQENFVTVLDGDERQKHCPGSIARRLVLQSINIERNGGQLANISADKVRSFIASGCNFGSWCPRIPLVRVLDMAFCVEESIRLDHIGTFLHLRYLSLADMRITELPREIRYLKFLQALILSESCIDELPEEVGLLTQLVCLSVDRRTRLPAGVIGKLTSLQELCIWPNDEHDTVQLVKELGMLRDLRVLRTQINDVTDESMEIALLESLGNNIHIRELYIDGSLPYTRRTTRHTGCISCRNLRYLHFKCFGFSELPAWIGSSLSPNLSYLDVELLNLKEQDMETLARLPELRCLKLRSHETKLVILKIRSTEVVGYFRKLKIFSIFGSYICFDLRGCGCNSIVASSAVTMMPSLESLAFGVPVRVLRDAALLSFDRLLDFENLGRNSLTRVTAFVHCGRARTSDVEKVEVALERTAAIHPRRPTLLKSRTTEIDMLSPYQEACMDELIKVWKLANIVGSGHIRALCMPDPEASSSKVIRLLYPNNGMALVALSSNAVHKLWKWRHTDWNPRGKSTSIPPQMGRPEIIMTNDTTDGDPEEATVCIALTTDDSCLFSASGGKVSLFDMIMSKITTTFMIPPPAVTFLALYPEDNSIMAFGREDSSILIYHFQTNKVKMVLRGAGKKITGLAFSQSMGILVSSDARGELRVWEIEGWQWRRIIYMGTPSNGSDTTVQFNCDETHLLAVHGSKLAIFVGNLSHVKYRWSPRDPLPSPISCAVYSSDGLAIYAAFCDGAIGIFEAEPLCLQCRIAPSAYIPSSVSSSDGGIIVYPTAVAAHPRKPNQFAVGMSNGAVYVLEPLEN